MSEAGSLFRSFLQAGFECSTHRNAHGQRLDLLKSSGHDEFLASDFAYIKKLGIYTIRTAVRWHLIENSGGEYNFDSLEPILNAADVAGIEVIPDLLHFGWPDHVDVFSVEFPAKFVNFTRALSRYLKARNVVVPFIAPVNEISYLAWAGGSVAHIFPFATGRGDELKRNLVRAAIGASDVLLNEVPNIRLISPEPVIHIAGNPDIPGDEAEAEAYTLAQFQTWDMLSGRLAPELGGRPEYLDILGVNFYSKNEWLHNSGPLQRDDVRFRPFHKLLEDVWTRYKRSMFVSETGTEDEERADWLTYICDEVTKSHSLGIRVHGICWYPILNHAGWDDDRHCHNGLFDYPGPNGERHIYEPLAKVFLLEQQRFARCSTAFYDNQTHRPDLLFASPLGVRVSTTSTSDEPVRSRPQSVLS